ncbi:acyl-CoA dehydrogenase family protein [uncultured Jatrophihabitans sp.]|uniref:acyl-CoA dehydrogenase family protein n=1 Tax=uncultured Jatrophihabitans sp. TaxID=1610747 RepID=UPI0035CA9E9B
MTAVSTETAAVAAARELLARHPVATTPDAELRGLRFDAGLAFVHFDEGRGGRNLSPAAQPVVEQVFADAGCPDWTARNVIGLGMAAPTVHAYGSEPQKDLLLRPLFTGADIWCQLFSEPGAGSDLAGLSTRAVRVEGGWAVTGQKVWTTLAHVARWGLLLARTDPDQPKHRGLTYFVLDMGSPGVEVRPLRQLTGEAEFNEVYLDDVFVPDDAILGELGAGWRVATTTLMNERVSLGGRAAERGAGPIGQAVAAYRAAADAGRLDPGDLDRLMRLWTRSEAARLTNQRAVQAARRGTPGPEGSIAKVQMAELNKAVYDLTTEFLGPAALLFDGYAETRPEHAAVHGGSGDLRYDYLRSLANSIEGGTSEILRNVLGERVLGLPPEPRVDKDVPWAKAPKS